VNIPPVIWFLAAVIVLAGAAVLVTKRLIRAGFDAAQRSEMARIEAEVETALRTDRRDDALSALEQALARKDLPWGDKQRAAWQVQRDRLARGRIADALERVRQLEPEAAMREGLIWLRRAEDDPAAAEQVEPLRREVRRASAQQCDRERTAVGIALESGRAGEALEGCERLLAASRSWPPWAVGGVADSALELARRIAPRYGVRLDPISGDFWLGSRDAYETRLRGELISGLKHRGYAPEPDDPALRPIWRNLAPHRIELRVIERPTGPYLQSRYQTAQLETEILLERRGHPEWRQRVQTRTEVPLPRLSAFEARQLALGSPPSPEAQRRIYANAFEAMVARLPAVFRMLPQAPDPPREATRGDHSPQLRPIWSSTTRLRLSPSPF
jgi:hypothetical protein